MDISALASAATATQSNTERVGIADDFDAFLQLLTTQLRNQNPLDPLDTNEFTAQLVQFSSVEQSIKTNDNLSRLLDISAGNIASSAVGFIGKTVSAAGNTAVLQNGAAQWSYNLSDAASQATITIKDSFGQTVFTKEGALPAGANTFQWDGKRPDGTDATPGIYSISIEAKNADGVALSADTNMTGTVEAVDMTGSEPILTVGGNLVKFSDIRSVAQ